MYNGQASPNEYTDGAEFNHRIPPVETPAPCSQAYPNRIDSPAPPLYSETHTDEQEISKALRWIPPPPQQPSQKFPRLTRIVAIPQIEPNSLLDGPRPFHRAYAPCLEDHAISAREFMAFIDNLSIAQGPNAVIQAAQVAGGGMGLVPEPITQFASLGIGIAADVAAAVTSATRTSLFLKKVNAEFFAPRRLKASIVRDAALRSLIGESSLERPVVAVDIAAGFVTVAERRLQALQNLIAPLTFSVPPPETQQNVIDRLSAKQLQSRLDKNRGQAVKKIMKADIKKEMEKEKGEEKERKREEKREKKEEKRREKGKGKEEKKNPEKESDRKKAELKALKEVQKAEEKEMEVVGKLKWIVVENL